MIKYIVTALCLIHSFLYCGPTSVGTNGGGASETVATVESWENSFKITIYGDKPFEITAEVCADSFSPADTEYFHMRKIITDQSPVWEVPYFPDSTSSIIIRNSADSTAVFMTFEKISVSMKKDPVSKQLTACGAVQGAVNEQLNDGTFKPLANTNVFIKGTFFRTTTDENGWYALRDIPVGNYELSSSVIVYKGTRSNDPITVAISGDTTVIRDITILQN